MGLTVVEGGRSNGIPGIGSRSELRRVSEFGGKSTQDEESDAPDKRSGGRNFEQYRCQSETACIGRAPSRLGRVSKIVARNLFTNRCDISCLRLHGIF